jgi:hypothetical protein
MTDVYLRYSEDAVGHKIGEVPFTEAGIDEAIRLVGKWSVNTNTVDYADVLSTTFVLQDGRAFFEIEVGSDE